jgi:hypothetical protein
VHLRRAGLAKSRQARGIAYAGAAVIGADTIDIHLAKLILLSHKGLMFAMREDSSIGPSILLSRLTGCDGTL